MYSYGTLKRLMPQFLLSEVWIANNKQADPDTRGGFKDFAGNYWAIGQQTN
jgi:hypothetical protein